MPEIASRVRTESLGCTLTSRRDIEMWYDRGFIQTNQAFLLKRVKMIDNWRPFGFGELRKRAKRGLNRQRTVKPPEAGDEPQDFFVCRREVDLSHKKTRQSSRAEKDRRAGNEGWRGSSASSSMITGGNRERQKNERRVKNPPIPQWKKTGGRAIRCRASRPPREFGRFGSTRAAYRAAANAARKLWLEVEGGKVVAGNCVGDFAARWG